MSTDQETVTADETDDFDWPDVIGDVLAENPSKLYGLKPGVVNTDENTDELLEFLWTHSVVWKEPDVETAVDEIDPSTWEAYALYLESIVRFLIQDLSFASHLVLASSQHAGHTNAVKAAMTELGMDPSLDVNAFPTPIAKKAWNYYIYGLWPLPSISTYENKDCAINQPYQFDDLVAIANSAPPHIQKVLADLLERVAPYVYTVKD